MEAKFRGFGYGFPVVVYIRKAVSRLRWTAGIAALGPLSPTAVRLVCAVHAREGDRLGYDWADLSLDQAGHATAKDTLALLTPAPAGPGFFDSARNCQSPVRPAACSSVVARSPRPRPDQPGHLMCSLSRAACRDWA